MCMSLASQFTNSKKGEEKEGTCSKNPRVFSLLPEYVAGTLSLADADEVRAHYNQCGTCKDYYLDLSLEKAFLEGTLKEIPN